MKIEEIERRLSVLREQKSRIDYAIQILEDQLPAEKKAPKRSIEIQTAQPAPSGESYVLQKVKCGKRHVIVPSPAESFMALIGITISRRMARPYANILAKTSLNDWQDQIYCPTISND